MSSILKVIAIENKVASDGRKFKSCTLQSVEFTMTIDPFTGASVPAVGQVVPCHINVWEKDSDAIGGKANLDYPNWAVGSVKMGKKVTRTVAPYEITDKSTGESRQSTTASVVVIGDSTSSEWESLVQKAFKANKNVLVNSAPVIVEVSDTVSSF